MNSSLEAYLEKLKKIPEIQSLRSKPGSWVVGDIYFDGSKLKKFVARAPDSPVLWAPREDQLKAIFGSKHPLSAKLVTLDLARFIVAKKYEPQSCEELFLDFLMEKLFNKNWNGKDWIEI